MECHLDLPLDPRPVDSALRRLLSVICREWSSRPPPPIATCGWILPTLVASDLSWFEFLLPAFDLIVERAPILAAADEGWMTEIIFVREDRRVHSEPGSFWGQRVRFIASRSGGEGRDGVAGVNLGVNRRALCCDCSSRIPAFNNCAKTSMLTNVMLMAFWLSFVHLYVGTFLPPPL